MNGEGQGPAWPAGWPSCQGAVGRTHVDEGVHDGHGLGADTRVRVHLLQHLVDVDLVGLGLRVGAGQGSVVGTVHWRRSALPRRLPRLHSRTGRAVLALPPAAFAPRCAGKRQRRASSCCYAGHKRTLEICLRAARLRFSATCTDRGRWLAWGAARRGAQGGHQRGRAGCRHHRRSQPSPLPSWPSCRGSQQRGRVSKAGGGRRRSKHAEQRSHPTHFLAGAFSALGAMVGCWGRDQAGKQRQKGCGGGGRGDLGQTWPQQASHGVNAGPNRPPPRPSCATISACVGRMTTGARQRRAGPSSRRAPPPAAVETVCNHKPGCRVE